ncbi:unnamed protein product [Dibothriocephalus latus]|uniref:VHS domain-containing protein n=1 Tax=Dibothriocephalus latus TaxID=60516 RepID=A0A3P7NL46_DIBLA|nr:unnamed protein product [Dibothriocephalus latus]
MKSDRWNWFYSPDVSASNRSPYYLDLTLIFIFFCFLERATDSGKPCIDWALILEICDALCETDDGPKDAIRAIRKRLTSSAGKDHLSVWYTLLLIEACVKNCGKRFQAQVANRDFLRDLIKLLLPKYDAPIQIQTKVLLMLKVS